MLDGYRIVILAALLFSLGAIMVIIWAVKSGYFEDIEEPKYRMLEDEE